ncbi:phenylalanine--tRNA ligase subunit beta [Xanthobacteraceae bacterium Astr-EGSB]|uniref:phenylalanine--tRNA ligase subunit beta n=1 Tax=Astrobacterium formosum TaxID=3069710 RepID=UPI0027B8023B|nr:phenylalanine--tRNA ligase subunit beta [Xanthobacteraceae bacterium Astr-EGSB]
MKFTLSWLKEHLDTDEPLDKIVDKLTMIGLEVESLEDKAKALAPFVIARVVDAKQHPNADRLRVCMVDTGDGNPIQVVCGAPNARTGLVGVFSPPGTFIPGKNITLSIGTIRGVESRGMLCSGDEIGISDDHDGIIELAADAPVGTPYATWAGLDDPVIDINLTPNRADCTGVNGIARDLAAADMGKFINPVPKPIRGEFPCPVSVKLDFGDTPSLCPAFALRLVRGVKNGPSPEWMQRRLIAIGLRPINALVDITNYMTYDRARPLHVFDAAKVKGNLTVRRGRSGESLVALDGKTYGLDESICVIADENGVESLAGIMGGEASGCSAETTDVLIESALWEPVNVAQTGRRLSINSDARYRFERGVDPAFMVPGLELATKMVLDICGGTASEITVAGEAPIKDHMIEFPLDELARLAGVQVRESEVKRVLGHLGFFTAGAGRDWKVAVPSWRADVEGKADLVEEVVRIIGVDRVPATPFPRGEAALRAVLTPLQNRTRKAKRAAAARGMVEAVTWSFISKPKAELFGGGQRELSLANPIAVDLSDMRPSLVPGLVAAAQKNADRGFADVALFEVGQVFRGDRPEDQFTAATGVRRELAKASGIGRHWSNASQPVDAFDAKGDAFAILIAAGAPPQALQVVPGGPAWLHPGRSGTIQIGPHVLGHFGELHPKALELLGAEGPLVAFEVILERIPDPKPKATRAKPALDLAAFHPVDRDFAFVVGRSIKAADLVRAAQSADRKLINNVTVFDVYEGKGIDPDKKSIAIAVTLQPRDKTMTDDEIEAVAQKIVAEVTKKTGGVLRA